MFHFAIFRCCFHAVSLTFSAQVCLKAKRRSMDDRQNMQVLFVFVSMSIVSLIILGLGFVTYTLDSPITCFVSNVFRNTRGRPKRVCVIGRPRRVCVIVWFCVCVRSAVYTTFRLFSARNARGVLCDRSAPLIATRKMQQFKVDLKVLTSR